jgi:hypothetical protein
MSGSPIVSINTSAICINSHDKTAYPAATRNTLRRFNSLYTDKQVLSCHLGGASLPTWRQNAKVFLQL